VYLNPLDNFVKRKLKIKHYGRYVDDMVLIHSDKHILLNAISRIREFMSSELSVNRCLQNGGKITKMNFNP